MAVSHTITNASTKFPVGSTVDVYAATAFTSSGTTAAGGVITTGVVAANGMVTFTGLVGDTTYWAARYQGGKWVTINFSTASEVAVAPDLATQAELDNAVTSLNTSIGARAAQTDLNALTTTVNGKAAQADLTALTDAAITSTSINDAVVLTQAAYDALATKVSTTLYIIEG